MRRLEPSSCGNGRPMLGTWISPDTPSVQNAQFILSVRKKTDGKWGTHKEVCRTGKTGHMKENNRRKRCVGSRSNTADIKDKILREFSKGFPRDGDIHIWYTISSHTHGKSIVIWGGAGDPGIPGGIHDILWLQELLEHYYLLMLFLCLH